MSERTGSRRRFRKKVIRRQDGELFDLSQRRPISVEELREYVRDGGLFEARTHPALAAMVRAEGGTVLALPDRLGDRP